MVGDLTNQRIRKKFGNLQWSECCLLNILTICIRCVLGVEPSNRQNLYCFCSHVFASRSRVWKRKYHIYENSQVKGISLCWAHSSNGAELWQDSTIFLCSQCPMCHVCPCLIPSFLIRLHFDFSTGLFPFWFQFHLPFWATNGQIIQIHFFLNHPVISWLLLYLCVVGDKYHFLLCVIQFLK